MTYHSGPWGREIPFSTVPLKQSQCIGKSVLFVNIAVRARVNG